MKQCPVCAEGALGFIAHPTPRNDEIIAVIATCAVCRYSFFYHLRFDEMLTEVVITINAEDESGGEKPPKFRRLRLVRS